MHTYTYMCAIFICTYTYRKRTQKKRSWRSERQKARASEGDEMKDVVAGKGRA